jgi:Domain of unknown function (DUF5060)
MSSRRMRVMRWILLSIISLLLLNFSSRFAAVGAQNATASDAAVGGVSETIGSDTDVLPYNVHPAGALTGELRRWHKVTIGFEAFNTSEGNATQNPFTDLRLDVTFTHASSNKTYVIPGYYEADGNAANSGSSTGSAWLAHFAPDEVGTWEWEASFVGGRNVAQNGGGRPPPSLTGRPVRSRRSPPTRWAGITAGRAASSTWASTICGLPRPASGS